MIIQDIFTTQTNSYLYNCVAEAEEVLKEYDKKRVEKCLHAIQLLWKIKITHSKKGWDGENAQPVSTMSYKNALIFVLLVPEMFPCPSPGVGADGKITLEWRRRDGGLVSLAFDDKGLINFIAFLPGQEIVCGTRPALLGYNDFLVKLIQKIY